MKPHSIEDAENKLKELVPKPRKQDNIRVAAPYGFGYRYILDWTRRAVRPLWGLPSRVPKIAQKSKNVRKNRVPENVSSQCLKLVFSGTSFDHLRKNTDGICV